MALKLSFKNLSWPAQLAVAVALGAGVLAAGEFAPAPFPLSGARRQLQDARNTHRQLTKKLASLQSFQKRHAELISAIAAGKSQLALLREALPVDEQLDQFILQVQQAAMTAGVSIRKITADAVIPQEDHYEMPFEMDLDGPYYGVEQFLYQLSLVPRIITVGDMKMEELSLPARFPTGPNATVSGTLNVKTFFRGTPQQLASAAARMKRKGARKRR